MSEKIIQVLPGAISGQIQPPLSKSDAHRALICSALAAGGHSPLDQAAGPEVWSDDLKVTADCLDRLTRGEDLLDCGESGTSLRLLIPVAAALGRQVTFTGRGRLPQRPLREYVDLLTGQGLTMSMTGPDNLPLQISGQLQAGSYSLPGNVSSQYFSGLLLALPLVEGRSRLTVQGPLESAPYVQMTLATMRAFGVQVETIEGGWIIEGPQAYQPADYQIERDFSQAAFWYTAAYGGNDLTITGMNDQSVQGDRLIKELLANFAKGWASYQIDVSQIPDLVPILALAAALTPATTSLVNAARLRLKESDRLACTREVLAAIGVNIQEKADGLVIVGGKKLRGGRAYGHRDHRLVMTLAIAGLLSQEGVIIDGAQAVNKSYPGFFSDLQGLGAIVKEI